MRPLTAPARCSDRRPADRRRGSTLILAVVLIVMLVMMGASFLQMARSDRRSSQQMDTRVTDYDDNELKWFMRTIFAPDLPAKTPTVFNPDTNRLEYGQIARDYPFTWSGTATNANGFPTPSIPGNIRDEIQGGRWITFPVEEGALARQVPVNDGVNGPSIADPRPGATGTLYRAAGVGAARQAFIGDISENMPNVTKTFSGFLDRGENDDMWLASTEPIFANTLPNGDPLAAAYTVLGGQNGTVRGYWPHVSNVRGVFLDLDTIIPGTGFPATYLSTADNNDFSGDTWLDLAVMQADLETSTNGGKFADADGDGIADARWTYAAGTAGGGLTYVAAFRVVDNSSLVNLNVASRNGAGGAVNELPRWYTPADLVVSDSFDQNVLGYAGTAAGAALNALMASPTGATGVRGTDNPVGTNRHIDRLTSWLLTGKPYRNAGNALPTTTDWDLIGSGLQELAISNPVSYPTGAGVLETAEDFRTSADLVAPGIGTLGIGGTNEVELRFGNGLNRRSQDNQRVYADAAVETRTSEPFWRSNVATGNVELSFKELKAGAAIVRPTIEEFFRAEPRKRFSGATGSGDFNRLNLNEADREKLRDFLIAVGDEIDLIADDTTTKNGMNLLQAENAEIGGAGGPSWTRFASVAAAFAMDWRDNDRGTSGNAAQATPELTRSVGVGIDYYGMEYLPFISEVYLKAEFDNEGVFTDPVGPPPADVVTWGASGPNDYQLIIELVNPWNRPIPIADLELELQDTSNDSTVAAFTGAQGLRQLIVTELGRAYLEPNEVIALHVGDFTVADELGEMNGALPAAVTRVDIAALAPAWPVAGGTWSLASNLALALRAPVEDGSDLITYQQFAVPEIPDEVPIRYTPLTPPGSVASTATRGSARVSVIGTAVGLNMLTVRPDDLELQPNYDPASPFVTAMANAPSSAAANAVGVVIEDINTTTPAAPEYRLATYNKGRTSADTVSGLRTNLDARVDDAARITGTAGAGTPAAAPSGTAEPFLIGNAGHFVRASDFFRIVFLGPRVDKNAGTNDEETIAEVWAASAADPANAGVYEVRQFMIDAAPDATTINAANPADIMSNGADDPPELRSTFAAFLLNRLSTFAPNNDGIDNDGDGRIDDTDEQLVPGRINLNTVPIVAANGAFEDTFRRALPLPPGDVASRTALAQTVKGARELLPGGVVPYNSGLRRGSSRSLAEHGYGLLSVADLLDINPAVADLALPAAGANVTGDFNEYESDLTPAVGVGFGLDGHTGDAEERLAALGAFNQVFDVRTDIVTVYILIRGYPTADFASGPQREWRITATVDRSVAGGHGVPRVLSYTRQDLR